MLLLDTQVVVWLADETHRVSIRAQQALQAAKSSGEALAVAGITLWELAHLSARRKLDFEPSIEAFLQKVEAFYLVVPLDRHIALRSHQFSRLYPKDPADRQIAATALVHGMTLISADSKIRASGEVPCLW